MNYPAQNVHSSKGVLLYIKANPYQHILLTFYIGLWRDMRNILIFLDFQIPKYDKANAAKNPDQMWLRYTAVPDRGEDSCLTSVR